MARSSRDPETIYSEHIAALPDQAKRRLMALIDAGIARPNAGEPVRLATLSGLGREVWLGVDADAYVNALRDEWDRD